MNQTPDTVTAEDLAYMEQAIEEAKAAAGEDEVPIGAILVGRGKIVGRGRNCRETHKIATGHAEMCAIEEACRTMGGWRLPDSTLYVTLEPCPMCMGAIINARVCRVVFGAYDPKAGAAGSVLDLNAFPLNHHPVVHGGVKEEECAALLSDYFKGKRKKG